MAVPEYQVQSTVWISNERAGERGAPIRAGEVLRETSWPDLLTSFAILDKVVRTMSLNLQLARPADSAAFVGFGTDERFRSGTYQLKMAESGWQYKLLDGEGTELQAGILGDSIGRKLGFLWKPSPALMSRGRTMEFTVVTPREAAMDLRDRISVRFPRESNLLRVTLTGSDPEQITAVMNALNQQFIAAAASLKKRSVTEAAKALTQQLDYSRQQLQEAEAALERYRVQTITLPTEHAAPGAGGGERVRDPIFATFFTRQIESGDIRRERQALEGTLAAIQSGQLDPSALWSVPTVQSSPAPELKTALADLAAKRASLREAQRTYTDDHKTVKDLKAEVDELTTQTIPRHVTALIAQQKRREAALMSEVQTTAEQLRAIPTRTVEEARLRREVEARGEIYSMLKSKHEEATLAEASTIPDVSILDAPAVPETPSRDRAPFIILMAVTASIAAAVGLALLLDQFDRRFRYADQATHEMGLDIIGVVPALAQTIPERRDPIEAAHAREAFRSIRLAVMHAFDTSGRAILTISSPGAGDGKSLLSSNLALSFADANCRTLLIDGDIRRGDLHGRFGVERLPGFVDYLAGGLTLDRVLRKTTHERLELLPRGASQLHGPELLLSPAMSALLAELERLYDVIIIDSPPLGAGIDPFVLATETGNMLLVLRSGETDRRLAQAKLKVLNRLPIRLLGAVLNATPSEGEYRYYSYLYSDLPEEAKGSRRGGLPLPVPVATETDGGGPPLPIPAASETDGTPLQTS
jgi:capsular exopolysaccharide synthesis family protein